MPLNPTNQTNQTKYYPDVFLSIKHKSVLICYSRLLFFSFDSCLNKLILTKLKYFKQERAISSICIKPLKLVDLFPYLGNNIHIYQPLRSGSMYHRTNVLSCKERCPQKKKYSNSKVREENIAVVFIQLWSLQLEKFILVASFFSLPLGDDGVWVRAGCLTHACHSR